MVPCYNEEDTLPELHRRISAALAGVDYELILVDDGSADATARLAADLARDDERVVALRLSRNFGHQSALTAGLDAARGDAIVTIDADLQDPPEVILELLQRFEDGADVVHAVRSERLGEKRLRLLAIKIFYGILPRLSTLHDYPGNTGDFRLLSRRAVDGLQSLPERNRFLRGLVSWIGYRQDVVLYERKERYAGESKYPFRKLLQLALDGILSFSVVPLRLASVLGLVFSALAFLAIPVVVVLRLLGLYEPTGIASVHILVLLIGGIQLFFLGVIGEYVGRTYDESKRRPLYLLDDAPPAER